MAGAQKKADDTKKVTAKAVADSSTAAKPTGDPMVELLSSVSGAGAESICYVANVAASGELPDAKADEPKAAEPKAEEPKQAVNTVEVQKDEAPTGVHGPAALVALGFSHEEAVALIEKSMAEKQKKKDAEEAMKKQNEAVTNLMNVLGVEQKEAIMIYERSLVSRARLLEKQVKEKEKQEKAAAAEKEKQLLQEKVSKLMETLGLSEEDAKVLVAKTSSQNAKNLKPTATKRAASDDVPQQKTGKQAKPKKAAIGSDSESDVDDEPEASMPCKLSKGNKNHATAVTDELAVKLEESDEDGMVDFKFGDRSAFEATEGPERPVKAPQVLGGWFSRRAKCMQLFAKLVQNWGGVVTTHGVANPMNSKSVYGLSGRVPRSKVKHLLKALMHYVEEHLEVKGFAGEGRWAVATTKMIGRQSHKLVIGLMVTGPKEILECAKVFQLGVRAVVREASAGPVFSSDSESGSDD